jgi:iron complex outermembrane receptor protein
LWAVHTFSNHSLQAGGGVRYVGETRDGTDLIRTPANTVFDAMIAYDLGTWRYALNVNNLFDEEYIAICLTRGDCWFGTRREIVASANYHF